MITIIKKIYDFPIAIRIAELISIAANIFKLWPFAVFLAILSNFQKITAIRNLIDSAQKSITTARKIFSILGKENNPKTEKVDMSALQSYKIQTNKIVEGIFTGESMLGSDGNIYPVPQNYASKSRIVEGSALKATIAANGKITYKIIKAMPYDTQVGFITMTRDKYQVVSEGKTYNVLLANITFLKANIGDTVLLRIPHEKEATYATLDAILPNDD